jgi:aspartate aminotransferase
VPRLAATVESTPHSGIRRMAELARAIPDAIRLDAGDPTFPTAPHIQAAAYAAMGEGFTKYTPSGGYASLRAALARKVRERNGIAAEPEQVIVTAGGCGGLFTSLMTLLDHGDEVLLPDPGWPNYRAMVHVLGATSVGYPVDLSGGTVDPEAVAARVTARTKVLLVNSPNNPTGAVYTPEVLHGLAAVAEANDLWLISDECYDEMVYGVRHTSLAAVAPSERLISVFSFSKTYAMTGWRLGYVVSDRRFADELLKEQEPVHGNASSVSQKAAEAALAGDQSHVAQMRAAYANRRDLALAMLSDAGIEHVVPQGAFYVMVDVTALGDSMTAARTLLQEQHVSCVPGLAFGPRGEGWVRVSLCVPDDVLADGLGRVVTRLGAGSPVAGA